MFESIIGELDTILLNLKLGKSFESTIMDIFLAHEDAKQIRQELARFGDRILESRADIDASSLWELL